MPKAMPFVEGEETTGRMIFCPACQSGHLFNTKPANPNGVGGGHKPVWKSNGDPEKSTFRAAMPVKCDAPDYPHCRFKAKSSVCRSFVTDDKIRFLPGATRPLAGKEVDLPDFNDMKGGTSAERTV